MTSSILLDRKTDISKLEANCPFKARTPSLEKRPQLQQVLVSLQECFLHMNVHITYKYWHLQPRASSSDESRVSVSTSASHVSPQRSVYLLIYLPPAGICFTLVTHYILQPTLHLKPAKSVDFPFIRSTWGSQQKNPPDTRQAHICSKCSP